MKVYRINDSARLPEKNNEDMCWDLFSNNESTEFIKWGEITIIKTGLIIDPSPYHFSIRPRSGLAVKHGLHIMAGQIDKSYRGELVVAITTLKKDYLCAIRQGDKIAQFKLEMDYHDSVQEVYAESELSNSLRKANGFGSTGV